MTAMQVAIVAITVGLTALDGYDVLAISFASPGIAKEWGIDRAALGVVLSMELLGMALGSVFIGGFADRIGRRKTVLGCLVIMSAGMAMVTSVKSINLLCIWRVLTGLGIGGMLATGNAIATEFSNNRRRDLSVALMSIGYPVGAVLGGSIAALLLRNSDWRTVFGFGAIVTSFFLPIVYFVLPESVSWLLDRRPTNVLERVNQSLTRIGHPALESLPEAVGQTEKRRAPWIEIFRPGLASTTILVTLTYFLHITTFYFILKWVPKIVVDMGFAPSSAAGVLVWANVGGALGGATLGLLAGRFGVKGLTITVLVGASVLLGWFGQGHATLADLSLVCAAAGFCGNAAIVGLYGVVARAFPTPVRASGTGFVVGVGRGGAVLGPIFAGLLFRAGYSLQVVACIMGLGSLIGAIVLAFLPNRVATQSSD
jgi:MFS family permease